MIFLRSALFMAILLLVTPPFVLLLLLFFWLPLRANRLGLLATLHQAMNQVADLSRLSV